MSVADEAAGRQIVTMDTDRYPTTLDIAVITVLHEWAKVIAAPDTAREVQVLDGVVTGRSEHGATAEVYRMAVAIESALEVLCRITYCEVGIQYGIHGLRAAVGQCRAECFPVISIVEDAAELLGGIAVAD